MVVKKLAVLVPAIMWKVENVPNELKGCYTLTVKNLLLFSLPVAYSKIARRKRKAEGRSSQQKEPGLLFLNINSKNWFLSKDQIWVTLGKTSSKSEAKGVAVKSFLKI